MVRLILALIAVLIFCIVTLPVIPVLLLIGRVNRRRRDIISLRLVQGIFKVILFIAGVKVTAIGEEHVPKDRPVLYVANHRGNFDTLVAYSRCPNITGFVAKESMKKVPFISMWMRFLYCLFMDRHDLRSGMKMILAAIEQIKSGISIFIFPEGTRSRGETELPMLPFHEGSLKIAQKTDCPVIPIAITNTRSIMERQMPRLRAAHVTISYGEPIIPSKLPAQDKKHLGEYTRSVIEGMLKETMDH